MLRGEARPTYLFGQGVIEGEKLDLSPREIRIPGQKQPISLDLPNPYPDMSTD